MSLHDPYLTEALKIQVQLLGAPQLAWRVQHYDRDLSLPSGQHSLFLDIDSTNGTTQQFDQDVRVVQWFTCLFIGHTPRNVDCTCKGCEEGDLDDANRSKSSKQCRNSEKEFKRRFDDGDPTIDSLSCPGKYEFLFSYKTQNESALPTQNGNIEETSNWQSKDILSKNRLLSTKNDSTKSIDPNQVKLATKENKLIDTSVQNAGLIKALEQRLQLIRLDKYLQRSSLFQFFDHQHKEMDFISDQTMELKYGRIELAENPIPLPTSFPFSPQSNSILRQDSLFSIFNDHSHMPLSFIPIPDENKFDIPKFV
ncbi:hypothetical protein R3W88_033495 [Solanum pinnatisectum]|uniref:Uncharacterized protein n=1 Tax=Solanum pinnatisectum TaxID=50273 RepID=A0AAV9K0T7_9SOLN|nr:hypothetical protein R3W88_033495 [Solanum pinnatisectum]